MELPNIVLVTNMSEQNPARPLTLRGAAARGALTFFILTREDNGIALNIVWATNTSIARWHCSLSKNDPRGDGRCALRISDP